MLKRIEKLQIVILGLLISIGLVLAVHTGSSAFARKSVSVTGSAYEIVKSDSGNIQIVLKVKNKSKAQAYSTAKLQMPKVYEYLTSNGIDVNKDVDVKSADGYYTYKTMPNGTSTNETDYYNFSQRIIIKSNDVNKIQKISLDINSLIDNGIDIEIYSTSYSYSKLSDLKVKLLKAATQDAKERASAMLQSTNNRVGKIESVKMGVFQITPTESTDVSDMGINDTSTIDKKVTAVANVVFSIK